MYKYSPKTVFNVVVDNSHNQPSVVAHGLSVASLKILTLTSIFKNCGVAKYLGWAGQSNHGLKIIMYTL